MEKESIDAGVLIVVQGEVGEHFGVIENGTAQVMDLRAVGFGVPEAD